MLMNEPYDIRAHRHRFAAWAASRAVSVKGVRFSVESGFRLLESCGVTEYAHRLEVPPVDEFDEKHRDWREKIVGSDAMGFQLTHGVAAKLINCYLKSAVVLVVGDADQAHRRVGHVHPPIDRLLLREVSRRFPEGTSELPTRPWSKFDPVDYERTIAILRSLVGDKPLWRIEEHWRGHQ